MMKTILAAVSLATVASAASAQTAPTTPPADHAAHANHANQAPLPTVNSPIKDLLANPATAAVLEKHLPGVSQHPALPQFKDMTLAEVAPMSGGAVTEATITAIETDLKALPAT
jgi:hypothetical protein